MEEQRYYFKISPGNLLSDLVQVPYTAGTNTYYDIDECCPITATTIETITGTTGVYTGLTYLLSGGTDGTSLLTGLTIPILFTQTAIDIGYYSVFDGAVLQSSLIKNFLFSADTSTPYTYLFYNTSETEYLKFLNRLGRRITVTNTNNLINNTYISTFTWTIWDYILCELTLGCLNNNKDGNSTIYKCHYF